MSRRERKENRAQKSHEKEIAKSRIARLKQIVSLTENS